MKMANGITLLDKFARRFGTANRAVNAYEKARAEDALAIMKQRRLLKIAAENENNPERAAEYYRRAVYGVPEEYVRRLDAYNSAHKTSDPYFQMRRGGDFTGVMLRPENADVWRRNYGVDFIPDELIDEASKY